MGARVAITGVGAVTPLGLGAPSLLDGWVAGESGIADGAGRCLDFEPTEHLSRKEARRSDRFTQMALVASDEALADAGWDTEPVTDPAGIGCVLGTGVGGLATIETQLAVLGAQGPGAVSPLSVPMMMANAGSGAIAMRHHLNGQCFGVVSACAAGAHAVGAGLRMIQHGDAEACVVGGAEAAITSLAVASFASMGATSPTGISRPFDARRDGFVMGEGAGVLVLENEELAVARGARIHGWLIGYGATADAHHLTAPDPSGAGAARAITLALRDASVSAPGIDYVNAHGTSTPLNDLAETEAIRSALGADAERIPVSSLKSAIGHLLGAAGAVEAAATVLALDREVLGPTLNLSEPDPRLGLDYVPLHARPLPRNGRPLRALSNSFGFGGHNAVLCMEGAA